MNTWYIPALAAMCVTAGLFACASLVLFLSLRSKVHKIACQTVFRNELTESHDLLAEQVAALKGRLEKVEEAKSNHAEWVAGSESLNLNRRGQVLRMHRRGESISQIASALRIGQGEIALIIKVFELSNGQTRPDTHAKFS